MYRLALNMLFGDRAKLAMLLCGLAFSALLMAQQTSVFFGIMSWTYTPIYNIRSTIWVSDPMVEQANDAKPMRDTELGKVRSVDGVSWAAPLHMSILQARMTDGNFKLITMVGIDADTFAGAPAQLTQGRIEDLRLPNTVIIDEWGAQLMGKPVVGSDGKTMTVPLKPGDTFEINDVEARIVGICKVRRAFTGGPFVYTTYDRAKTYNLEARRTLSFMLVEPRPGVSADTLCERIERETELKAWTTDTVIWDWSPRSLAKNTFWWFWKNTGIPFSFGTAVALGLFVGIAISGQTFYSFVLENLKYFAAIKAMGAGMFTIARMLLVQAFTAGLIGFGLGAGMAQAIGRVMIEKGMPPFVMFPQIFWATLILVLGISLVSAIIGIVKVSRVDAASVFRG
jgi:putative ABC transport system permease protein